MLAHYKHEMRNYYYLKDELYIKVVDQNYVI